jgi:hypothetical protein
MPKFYQRGLGLPSEQVTAIEKLVSLIISKSGFLSIADYNE